MLDYPGLPFIIINYSGMFGWDEIIVLLEGKLVFANVLQTDDKKDKDCIKVGIFNLRVRKDIEITYDVLKGYNRYTMSFPFENEKNTYLKKGVYFKDNMAIYDGKPYFVCFTDNGKKRPEKQMSKYWKEMIDEYIDICLELAKEHQELRCMFKIENDNLKTTIA